MCVLGMLTARQIYDEEAHGQLSSHTVCKPSLEPKWLRMLLLLLLLLLLLRTQLGAATVCYSDKTNSVLLDGNSRLSPLWSA